MIAFFADNHFKARPGYHLAQKLNLDQKLIFEEDRLGRMPEILDSGDCELLMLNWISDTSGNEHPGEEIEEPLKRYVASGKPLLLIHGASAAFHRWDWWREMVGLRWVRGEDPDGFEPSTHPVRPYNITVAKTRHPLAGNLVPFELPKDEIYINMEQTCPITTLMETHIEEGTFPQAYIANSPYGSTIGSFIPGHAPEAFECPELVQNVEVMIQYLLENA